jgi:hypothetical protein
MRFSASLIRKWMTCPLQVKFDLEVDRPESVNAKTMYGSFIHEALEHYNNTGNIDEAKTLFLYSWENMPEPDWWPRGSTFHGLRQKGEETLDEYHNKHQWETRQIIGAEHRFCVPMGDHELSGIVDLLEIRKNSKGKPTLCVVDYKSAGKKPSMVSLGFDIQFTAYVYASLQPEFWFGRDELNSEGEQKYTPIPNAEDMWDYVQTLPREAIWYHLNDNKEIPAGHRNQGDYDRLYRCMEEIANAIDKGVFVPNISADTCQWCPYTDICTVVSPVRDRLDQETPVLF